MSRNIVSYSGDRLVAYADPELSTVGIHIYRVERSLRYFPNPAFVPVDLTPAQARRLIKQLTNAVDDLAEFDRGVEAYFANKT